MTPSEIKVAWIAPVLGVDGNLLYAEPLLKAFAEKFKSFRIFTGDFIGNTASLQIERCASLRLHRNERKTHRGRTSYRGGLRLATPSLIRKLASYEPDLLILIEYSIFSLYGILYARLRARKTPTLLIMEAKPRFPERPGLRHARILFRRFLVKRVDAVLTNNQEGRRYLTEVLDVPDHLIISEPFLVSDVSDSTQSSDAQPSCQRQHTGSRPVRFLFVGQLIPRKGIKYALIACARLLPKHAGRFVYEIVGDGPCRSELEAQAKHLGLDGHILFRGRQRYDAVGRFYSEADVFLFPTLADYRSLVPFEALSSGLPILASVHDGGISETVCQGENGFAFDPLNAEQLAGYMSEFIEKPELISPFSAKSLELAKRFTLPRAVTTLLKACHLAFARSKGFRI
jgi:glycosyltransferase involved in cell wall biosynthesis